MESLPGTDCWLSPLARVDRSPIHGDGLFAVAPLTAGTVVSRFGGRLVSDAEQHRLFADAARSGTYVDALSLAADLNLVLPPDAPQHAGNHSCDPNTWWVDPCTVLARRDVAPGEELTLDYATITDDPDFAMPCSCRAVSCRGRVTGRDWRLPTLQAEYGPHWVPILRERIAASRPPAPGSGRGSGGWRAPVDVDVEVGDREHECCGAAIARDDVVDLDCIVRTDPDGRVHLVETHHDLDGRPHERVRGRVVALHLVEDGVPTRALVRVPRGRAATGWDAAVDGHLQDARTGEVFTSDGQDFLVTVRTTR